MGETLIIHPDSDETVFRIGRRRYRKLGEVQIDHKARRPSKNSMDFVPLSEVKRLVPQGVDHENVVICGNQDGVKVYEFLG